MVPTHRADDDATDENNDLRTTAASLREGAEIRWNHRRERATVTSAREHDDGDVYVRVETVRGAHYRLRVRADDTLDTDVRRRTERNVCGRDELTDGDELVSIEVVAEGDEVEPSVEVGDVWVTESALDDEDDERAHEVVAVDREDMSVTVRHEGEAYADEHVMSYPEIAERIERHGLADVELVDEVDEVVETPTLAERLDRDVDEAVDELTAPRELPDFDEFVAGDAELPDDDTRLVTDGGPRTSSPSERFDRYNGIATPDDDGVEACSCEATTFDLWISEGATSGRLVCVECDTVRYEWRATDGVEPVEDDDDPGHAARIEAQLRMAEEDDDVDLDRGEGVETDGGVDEPTRPCLRCGEPIGVSGWVAHVRGCGEPATEPSRLTTDGGAFAVDDGGAEWCDDCQRYRLSCAHTGGKADDGVSVFDRLDMALGRLSPATSTGATIEREGERLDVEVPAIADVGGDRRVASIEADELLRESEVERVARFDAVDEALSGMLGETADGDVVEVRVRDGELLTVDVEVLSMPEHAEPDEDEWRPRADELVDETTLARREAEVRALKELGLSHGAIADVLDVSRSTVDEYSSRINRRIDDAESTLTALGVVEDGVDRGDGPETDGGEPVELIGSDAAVTRASDGEATAYTIAAVDLDAHPALDGIGFPDGGRFYLVLTSGAVVASDYDRHRLGRETGERWLTAELSRLDDALDGGESA